MVVGGGIYCHQAAAKNRKEKMMKLAEEAKKKTQKVNTLPLFPSVSSFSSHHHHPPPHHRQLPFISPHHHSPTTIPLLLPLLPPTPSSQTDIELENQAQEETIRALAQEKLDNELDLVKYLHALSCQAEAFTIRDTQRKDKEKVYAQEKGGGGGG